MVKTSYPKGSDIGRLLELSEIHAPMALELDDVAESTVARFEKAVGWRPFLVGKKSSTRRFIVRHVGHLGKSLLELDSGLVKLDAIKFGDGHSTLKVGEDFDLMPLNARKQDRPYEWIQFYRDLRGMGTLKIRGKWGYCDQLPEEIWHAILRQGVIYVSSLLGLGHGNLEEWSEGDVKESYSSEFHSKTFQEWQDEFDEIVWHYRRIQVGV